MGQHYRIRTEKTGHYYTHGTITEKTRYIWICLHGYGQLAKNLIQKFEFLPVETHHVIVPEGLSRFYFEGVNERPVASWMTREDRLDEIADYVLYLETLRHKIGWDKPKDVKVIYFGFSQGVTTLIRWLTNIHPRVDHLIMWAGQLPDDIILETHKAYFEKIPATYFIGKRDPYFSSDRVDLLRSSMVRSGLKPNIIEFDGEHKVEVEVLRKWVEDQKL